jgi:colicin import membrane protein
MKTAYTISAVGHAAILLWSVFSFAAKPLPSSTDSMPVVDLVSISEFSKITAGVKDAPKQETPKPLVEKVADAKPVEEMATKVDNKEVKAAREAEPSPPAPKPVEAKPEPKTADAKPAETKAPDQKVDPKPDPIADALAKDAAKKPEPKQAAATPMPPRKPAPPAPKFDARQVEALLDKRDSTRLAAAGHTPNATPSVGLPRGNAEAISMSELDALRARLASLWNIPAGAKDPRELTVLIRVKLKPDGTLNGPPMVMTSGSSPLFAAARDSAIRALFRGQPYDMLRPETYENWKDIEITFDPKEMIRG